MGRFVAVVLIALLTGCTTGPDYRRPPVDPPQTFRFEAADAAAAADTQWWRQFQDPVLDELIAQALADNPNVRIAAAKIAQAAGVLTQTGSQRYPQLGYSGAATEQRVTERGTTPLPAGMPNPQDSYQVLAGASWEIDLWGRIRRLTEAAQADLLASEEARRGVILSLVASVATNYIQLLGLDEQLAISKRTLSIYAESVRLFELQFEHGQVSQMNVVQARSQYETAAVGIPQIESKIAQTEHALCILLGRNPGPIPRGRALFSLSLPPVPAALPSQVLARRPDILQAEQSLVAANARIGSARALYFPSISLTGNLGAASAELSDLFTGPAHVWNLSGSITGPIFDGGAIDGQVRQAEAGREAALLSYEAAIQSAFADVENALVNQSKTLAQLDAQERLVAALKQYVALAKLQYDGGYTPFLGVLYAEQQLFPAELNFALVRTSLCQSYINIYKAMGGGWVAAAETMTGGDGAKAVSQE